MIRTADVDVVADHVSPRRQGWTRETTVEMLGHKVRATVYRDSYDFQSRIYVEVWNPASLSWSTIRALAGEDHGGLPSAYGAKADTAEGKQRIFAGTAGLVDELLAYAEAVLS